MARPPKGTRRGISVLATGIALLSCAWVLPGAAAAATLTVTTTAEGTPGDGLCSLRDAVLAANANGADPSDCAKGDGADVIELGPLRYTLSTVGNDETGALGDLDVTDHLTIVGADAATTVIDGNGIDRVLDVKAATVSLQRLTITDGRAPDGAAGANVAASTSGTQGLGQDGAPGGGGGGIRSAGTLSLIDCIVSDNQAGTGGAGGHGTGAAGSGSSGTAGGTGRGGRGEAGGHGGGILSTGGSLSLERTIVRENVAGAGGAGGAGSGGNGGLHTGSTGTGGTGGSGFGGAGGIGGSGGGVAVTGGALQIVGSTIEGNRAGAGGAMGDGFGAFGGPATGEFGTGGNGGQGNFNTASGSPGASGGSGGGISADSAVGATISSSLIVGNASGAGGRGADTEGGRGGGVIEEGRPAGSGGAGVAGNGGYAGRGGGVVFSGLLQNSTVAGNATGPGGDGGNATGGKGGTTPGGSSNGGFAFAGDAGGAGWGGGVEVSGSGATPSLLHDTVAGNTLGPAGAVGTAVGGARGDNAASGTTGPAIGGTPAAAAAVGGVYATGAALANTIVSGNASSQCLGGSPDGGHNISFPDTTCPGAHADPRLGPLADNGGPTKTFALLAGSPAVGGVPAAGAGCLPVDQRGIARPHGAACDIGAYEQAPPVVMSNGATGVTTSGATLQGAITPNLRTTTYRFEFGPSPAYGSATPEGSVPAGGAAAPVSAALSGLAPGTTYHYRLVATNADGTTASADGTFTTAAAPAGGGDGAGGGGGPGTGGGQGAGALPPAKADLSRTGSSIRVDRRRRFALRFRAGPSLAGDVVFKSRKKIVTLARKAFTVPADGRVTLRARLSKRDYRILKRTGRIRARVTVTLTNTAGATSRASKRVVFRARS